MMKKIAIIKLGALGDVVRTLPLLVALKEKSPDSEIHWVTKPPSKSILETHPQIDRVLTIPIEIQESFDVLYNLDIDKEATELANKILADKKYGFFSEEGFASAFNIPAEYYLNTLFDDELKRNNKKTYQQMMFEAAELPYAIQHSPIFLTEEDKQYSSNFIEENNINTDRLIGIHMGASSRWPSKVWSTNRLKEFIIKAKARGYNIILFAGLDERQKQEDLILELKKKGIEVYKNDTSNTIRQFASLVNLCDVMVCSNSLSMHISLALKKPTIGLFFCTPPHEVEGYNLLKKITSPMLYDFFPEKMDQYDENLVNSISAEEVLDSIQGLENDESS